MSKLLIVVLLSLAVFWLYSTSWAQVYSEYDTLRILPSGGFPGDTVVVPFDLINTRAIGGFQCRVTYDSGSTVPIAMDLTERSQYFRWFGADFSHPGVASFFAVSNSLDTSIAPGSGLIATLSFVVSGQAAPGAREIVFEDSGPYSHENSLSNPRGDTMIIPVLVNGQLEIYPSSGIIPTFQNPASYRLAQNYPNPFNGTTVISFTLDQPTHANLAAFDILGQEVAGLYSGPATAGAIIVSWDGRDSRGQEVVSGIYFYRLVIEGGKTETKRMTLLK